LLFAFYFTFYYITLHLSIPLTSTICYLNICFCEQQSRKLAEQLDTEKENQRRVLRQMRECRELLSDKEQNLEENERKRSELQSQFDALEMVLSLNAI